MIPSIATALQHSARSEVWNVCTFFHSSDNALKYLAKKGADATVDDHLVCMVYSHFSSALGYTMKGTSRIKPTL
jgi:hypothetical protein